MTRVLIADDHAYTRAGIRQALETEGFEVVGEVATGRRAVEEALAHKPDIALLDIQMPDGTGTWAAYEITQALPDTAVVMLTYSRTDQDVFDSLRAGACGYLVKDMDPDRLGPALRNVLAGEVVFPRSLMQKVTEHFRGRARGGRRARSSGETLTERETEVANLMCEGASTDEIATRLAMSPVTVRVHISNIVRKLRVTNREEAVELLKGR